MLVMSFEISAEQVVLAANQCNISSTSITFKLMFLLVMSQCTQVDRAPGRKVIQNEGLKPIGELNMTCPESLRCKHREKQVGAGFVTFSGSQRPGYVVLGSIYSPGMSFDFCGLGSNCGPCSSLAIHDLCSNRWYGIFFS